MADAARLLREGGVVAFPTETVYGLGANALNEAAVRRVYELKGRPAESPLIVHVPSVNEARALAAEWPAEAEQLAAKHWPGPLTIVVRKNPIIPDLVSAGLPTVGLRVPSHPVAQQLLREAAVPVAAPSANRFTQLSPTTAEHVRNAFGDAVPVLEGGASQVGIESTVVSVLNGFRVLRPGMIVFDPAPQIATVHPEAGPHEAPGQHRKHYSPRTPVIVVQRGDAIPPGAAYVFHTEQRESGCSVRLPADPGGYAELLYRALHDLDKQGFAAICVEQLPPGAEWQGLSDRLKRASS